MEWRPAGLSKPSKRQFDLFVWRSWSNQTSHKRETMIIHNFQQDILDDYERNLAQGLFFDPPTGAVYEPGRENGAPAFLFTEVTGYAILDYILLHSLTEKIAYIEKARQSANWIINAAQDPCGGVLTRFYFADDSRPDLADSSFSGKKIFAFDTAICLRGLVALYTVTKEEPYLKSAQEMGKFLLEKMMGEGGWIHAIYDAGRSEPLEDNPKKWSRRFGAYHSKVAEALIDLYGVTREERYRLGAESVCSRIAEFQSPSGNFETSVGLTHLHPQCYAAEGLLHVGRESRNEQFIEMARRATEWALNNCENGEIAQDFDFNTGAPRSRFRTDALAQTLALAADLHQIDRRDNSYIEKMDELAAKILRMKSDGGYYRYGYYESDYNGGTEANTLSYWTNMFCLRGLYKYYLSSLLDNTSVVILAGGIGSRCWPISCESKPKPLSLSLLGDRTTLQETIGRYTYDSLIKPSQVFVLCSEKGLADARAQAGAQGIPEPNIIVEQHPAGTIPAVFEVLKIFSQPQNRERLLVVSMADNLIRPYETFQTALISALFAARERDCMVSIGKPIDIESDRDQRFGHIRYGDAANYRAHEVDCFEEKPSVETLTELQGQGGKYAWECGTVVFREKYYTDVTPRVTSGNLAQDLLSTVGKPGGITMAVSLLGSDAQFEDFGVPGHNLQRFWLGSKYDRGNGNVCLGPNAKVQLLASTGNLIVSDQLAIQAYGLKNYLILDNATTNTSVVMPLSKVDALPTLYRMLREPEKFKAFITGGHAAASALPTSSVIESPAAHASSEYGLALVFGCEEKIAMRREPTGLWVANEEYPQLAMCDFEILSDKEREDPKLAEHLIQVTALAESFLGGNVVLSDLGRNVLKLLCLYHDFGGYLNQAGVERERNTIAQFKKVSRLDRQLLDSRIVYELLTLNGHGASLTDESTLELLDDSVNSAVQLLRRRSFEDDDIRDIVVLLLQAQDNLHLLSEFRKDFQKMGFSRLENELDAVFACLKIAENFANGRWLWKRSLYPVAAPQHNGFMRRENQPYNATLEDFPFTIALTIRTLEKAEIAPRAYIDRLNETLVTGSPFFRHLMKYQENKPLLICDRIYLYLVSDQKPSPGRIEEILDEGVRAISEEAAEAFQFAQIAALPTHLAEISENCTALKESSVEATTKIVAGFYHKHWQLFHRHVCRDVIERLQFSAL